MNFEYLLMISCLFWSAIIKKIINIKDFKANGLDGIYFYFVNKNFKKILSNLLEKNIIRKSFKSAKNKILTALIVAQRLEINMDGQILIFPQNI